MLVEAAQLLCNAHDESVSPPYKRTHYGHPCSVWTRSSIENYDWLLVHADELCYEFERRFDKSHKTRAVIDWCIEHKPNVPAHGLTPFAVCIPDELKVGGDVVESYRRYYVVEKSKFAKWEPRTRTPSWWPK